MWFALAAEAVMAVHFAVLAYIVFGGFLGWWRRWAVWPHLAFAGWGFSSVLFGLNCPLTYAEDRLRRGAGQRGIPDGFIDHYLTGVLYPVRYKDQVQWIAAAAVVVSWAGTLALVLAGVYRRHARLGSPRIAPDETVRRRL